MGAYKFYNPTTQEWEIIKSKSIIKDDGSLEYTPDQIKVIDDTVSVLTALPTTTGTANTYLTTISGLSSLPLGLKITVKFHLANTGASTININGLGAKSITKAGGSALTSGTVKVNGVYTLVYDGTSFQLQGEGGEYGTALASDVLSGKTIGTEDGLVTGTIPVRTNTDTSGSYPTASEGQYSNGNIWLKPTAGYYNGGIWVHQSEPNLTASNVKSGVVLGNHATYKITGTYKGYGTATAANVLSGATFSTESLASATGTMPNRGAVTSTLTTQGGSYTIPSGYHSGAGKVTASFSNLVAGNIKSGVNIGGVVGTLSPLRANNVSHTYSSVLGTGITSPEIVLIDEGSWDKFIFVSDRTATVNPQGIRSNLKFSTTNSNYTTLKEWIVRVYNTSGTLFFTFSVSNDNTSYDTFNLQHIYMYKDSSNRLYVTIGYANLYKSPYTYDNINEKTDYKSSAPALGKVTIQYKMQQKSDFKGYAYLYGTSLAI